MSRGSFFVADTDEMERLRWMFGYMSFERKNDLFEAMCFSLFAVESADGSLCEGDREFP